MSDQRDDADAAYLSRLNAQFIAVGAGDPVCPICANRSWWHMTSAHEKRTFLATGMALDVYSLACTNCGFLREHVAEIVDGKVRPRGAVG